MIFHPHCLFYDFNGHLSHYACSQELHKSYFPFNFASVLSANFLAFFAVRVITAIQLMIDTDTRTKCRPGGYQPITEIHAA